MLERNEEPEEYLAKLSESAIKAEDVPILDACQRSLDIILNLSCLPAAPDGRDLAEYAIPVRDLWSRARWMYVRGTIPCPPPAMADVANVDAAILEVHRMREWVKRIGVVEEKEDELTYKLATQYGKPVAGQRCYFCDKQATHWVSAWPGHGTTACCRCATEKCKIASCGCGADGQRDENYAEYLAKENKILKPTDEQILNVAKTFIAERMHQGMSHDQAAKDFYSTIESTIKDGRIREFINAAKEWAKTPAARDWLMNPPTPAADEAVPLSESGSEVREREINKKRFEALKRIGEITRSMRSTVHIDAPRIEELKRFLSGIVEIVDDEIGSLDNSQKYS